MFPEGSDNPGGQFDVRSFSEGQRLRFFEGIRLFNEGRFWESHEAWEDVWREIEGDRRVLVQGLIQAAAGYHLVFTRPRHGGASRNVAKALEKLERFPAIGFGVDLAALRGSLTDMQDLLARLDAQRMNEVSQRFKPMIVMVGQA